MLIYTSFIHRNRHQYKENANKKTKSTPTTEIMMKKHPSNKFVTLFTYFLILVLKKTNLARNKPPHYIVGEAGLFCQHIFAPFRTSTNNNDGSFIKAFRTSHIAE